MEQFKEWAEKTLRINLLKDQPVHIKRKVYNIYKRDIFDKICEEVECKWGKILQEEFHEVNNPYYQQFIDFHDIEFGDPSECV